MNINWKCVGMKEMMTCLLGVDEEIEDDRKEVEVEELWMGA